MSVLTDYNPTFLQPVKGSWKPHTHFYTLNVGSDAYVMEREHNEMQWTQVERAARTVREITDSGILTVSDIKTHVCFDIINNDKYHLNGFEMPKFQSLVNGYITDHIYYKDGEDRNVPVQLPNPPITGKRRDFLYLEFWFEELGNEDETPKYGYIENDPIEFPFIDERIEAETARRIQLQWCLSHYEDYDEKCDNGFLDLEGNIVTNIHPTRNVGFRANEYSFVQADYDPYLFIAGEGLIKNQKIKTVDGYVYAIPLFLIDRINNSGFNAQHNPFGGVDYVDDTTQSDRTDGKFANIIYDDQIHDLRHLASLGIKQYSKIYVTLEEYYTDCSILKNKINRLTEDLDNADKALKNIGLKLPNIHDKEIYGVEIFGQYGRTAGAMLRDVLNEDQKIVYRKNKFYTGKRISDNYAVVPTLIDYDFDSKGMLGDLFIRKKPNNFRIYNTGRRNLRLNIETFAVDNETIYSGESTFNGLEGTFIDMPFEIYPERYFVHICPLENTNGRNGEIFVRMFATNSNQFIVYNTGLNTNNKGNVSSSVGNKFQWTVIDMQSEAWKNINYINIELNGQEGVSVSSTEFGEDYRLSLGTPIIESDVSPDTGYTGEVYADLDNEDIFSVYNTGAVGSTVQCLIFNDIEYDEYYDAVDIPIPKEVPTIVVKEQ